MTARTLVAGGGNWSNSSTWSPAGVPAAGDVLTLSGSGNLTVDGTSGSPNLCRGVTISGYSGNITMGATAYIKVGDATAGAFELSTTGTLSINVNATIEFVSTVTGNTFKWLSSGSNSNLNYLFSGGGGGWTATTDMYSGTGGSGVITHTAGSLTLNTGNQNCVSYIGTGTTTRSLTYAGGSNTWSINGGKWDITDSTNMTLSVSSLTLTTSNSVDFTFNGGGLTYGALIQTVQEPNISTIINQANTFSSVTLSGAGDFAHGYIFGANQTCTGTWTGNGTSASSRLYYHSDTKGSARTISAATFSFTYIDLEDITKGGAGSGNISAITGGSGDCTGNSGWTFTSPQNNYWVPAGGTSTGTENVVTNWASSSGGTAGTGRVPLPQDTAIFDANSIDAGSRTITQNIDRMGAHTWTGVTNSPTWTLVHNSVSKFYGSITMVAGMTMPQEGGLVYAGELASNFNTAGITSEGLTIDCSSNGTLVIPAGATSSVNGFSMASGTCLVLGTLEHGNPGSSTGGTIQIGLNGLYKPFTAGFPVIECGPGLTNQAQKCSMYFG